MNYASVITIGVVALSLSVPYYAIHLPPLIFLSFRVWYFFGGHKHYAGPVSNIPAGKTQQVNVTTIDPDSKKYEKDDVEPTNV